MFCLSNFHRRKCSRTSAKPILLRIKPGQNQQPQNSRVAHACVALRDCQHGPDISTSLRLDALVEKAGLTRWPRITHNLRVSRQTELGRDNPTHVVSAIMGNTPAVAHRHYLQTSVDDLMKAAGQSAGKAAQNPALHGAELGDWFAN